MSNPVLSFEDACEAILKSCNCTIAGMWHLPREIGLGDVFTRLDGGGEYVVTDVVEEQGKDTLFLLQCGPEYLTRISSELNDSRFWKFVRSKDEKPEMANLEPLIGDEWQHKGSGDVFVIENTLDNGSLKLLNKTYNLRFQQSEGFLSQQCQFLRRGTPDPMIDDIWRDVESNREYVVVSKTVCTNPKTSDIGLRRVEDHGTRIWQSVESMRNASVWKLVRRGGQQKPAAPPKTCDVFIDLNSGRFLRLNDPDDLERHSYLMCEECDIKGNVKEGATTWSASTQRLKDPRFYHRISVRLETH